ncbi:MAG: hypothetical protein ABMA13_18945 [Chthoniobacteraceae bacterium]
MDAALKKARQEFWAKHGSDTGTPGCLILGAGSLVAALTLTAAPIIGVIAFIATPLAFWIYASTKSSQAHARLPLVEQPFLAQRAQIEQALKDQLEFLNSPSA